MEENQKDFKERIKEIQEFAKDKKVAIMAIQQITKDGYIETVPLFRDLKPRDV